MLTKPLGTGILTTAAKAELLSGAEYRAMTDLMAALNRDAARAAVPLRPSACTDVTGFGLIGHARRWRRGRVHHRAWPGRVPIVPQALELARDGIIPAGPTAIWSLPGRRWRRRGPSPRRCWTASTTPRPPAACSWPLRRSGGGVAAPPGGRGVTAAAVGRVRPRGPRRIVLKPSRTGRRRLVPPAALCYTVEKQGGEAWKP